MMLPGMVLQMALVAVPPGVPSFASFASIMVDADALGGPVVMIAAGTGTAVLLAAVLAFAWRRRPASRIAAAEAQRRNEATDRRVAAALIRRTLNRRGRPHFDDEAGSPGTPSENPVPRRLRRPS